MKMLVKTLSEPAGSCSQLSIAKQKQTDMIGNALDAGIRGTISDHQRTSRFDL
jgi:hypothetical protein